MVERLQRIEEEVRKLREAAFLAGSSFVGIGIDVFI